MVGNGSQPAKFSQRCIRTTQYYGLPGARFPGMTEHFLVAADIMTVKYYNVSHLSEPKALSARDQMEITIRGRRGDHTLTYTPSGDATHM